MRPRAARTGLVAAIGLALVLTLPGTAIAAPGDLDPTFSGDGKVLTNFADDDQARDVAVQPDGKIVSVGASADYSVLESRFALTRHNPDGNPDTGFGGQGGDAAGTVTTPVNNMGPSLQWSAANAVALQADGKIVVVGMSWREYEDCCWFVVARYNADGTLDSTFGDGGRVFADIAGPTEANDVAIDSNGRIVAAGYTGGEMAVLRLNSDGTPDTTFGGDGTVTANPAGPVPQEGGDGRALALQPDGKIVVGGQVGSTRFDFALMRFNSNGSVDTSFDGDGIVRTDFGGYEAVESLAVQSDGKIVAAGAGDDRAALARYNSNGSLDTSFDGDGRVTTPAAGAADLALQPDGRIVTAGGSDGDFTILRYTTGGSLDGSFGTGGRATADFGGADTAYGVKLDSAGRIVAAGAGGPNTDFALARFQGGGSTPPPPPAPDLSVTKSGPGTVTIGDRATYTMTVTNTTAATTATGVTLTDTLSGPGASVVSATTTQGTCTISATGASCNLGTLAGSSGATVTVVVEPRATGTLRNTVTAAATQSDPAPGNNTATATTTVNNARGCTIIGTSASETLNGTGGNDVICGLGGNDIIRAGNGNDTAHGNYGDDNIDGGSGDDTLNGGPGNDTLTGYIGNDRLITADGVGGNDTANGGAGFDTCTTDPGDTRISCP
ncbi:calcium-binding protein [Streptomyces sp. AK08-02]|uniref:calcium-binding protein n=1 Tax=Streptomyces sp. AK08-02 TaxID=3028654 RepID=UPI0029A58ED4|nr:calcium-binding protein [Streptomyces sp. AK08-02]MDX3751136.1 calcium-binding protein [Streptomyces sp. AK08-02]